MTPEEIAAITKANKELEARLEKAEAKQAEYDKQKENLIANGYPTAGASYNSDESKALRYFGVSHPKQLLSLNTCDPRFVHVPQELKGLVISLKQDVDVARMVQQVCYGEPQDREIKGRSGTDLLPGNVKGVMNNYYGKNILAPKLKAFGSTTPTEGDEWVPTALSSSYIEEFELERVLARQFRTINMTTNPFEIPVQENVTTARIQAEGATISQANFNTDKITFSATKLAEFTILPEELNEDSAPNILALSRQEVVEASGRAIETAILNGDTAGTHQDADTTAADDARKAWDGLRKKALANSATIDFLNAAVTVTKLRDMRTLGDKFMVNPRSLMWIVSPKIYMQFLALDETTTVEKFGNMATILRGQLAALDGIPIVISEFARDDLNAAGVQDGVTTDRSGVLLVNSSRAMLGVRRPIRVRAVMDPTPPNDRWLMCSWWRGDFQSNEQDANEQSIVYGINVA